LHIGLLFPPWFYALWLLERFYGLTPNFEQFCAGGGFLVIIG
jgi:hypothetical protein